MFAPPCVNEKQRLMRSNMKKSYADMDPIEEIRAIREELSREFPTTKALCDYLRANSSVANPMPEPQCKDRRASAKTRANTRPAIRQRKMATHA